MKIITTKEPVYKRVIKTHKEKTVYETEDGRQFTTEKQAREWEELLEKDKKFKAIKHVEISLLQGSFDFYYISNEEELQIIVNRLYSPHEYNYLNGKSITKTALLRELKINQWICVNYFNNHSDRDDILFYTKTFLDGEILKYWEAFK